VGLQRLLVPLGPWRYYDLSRVAERPFHGRCLDVSSPKLLMSLLQREGRGDWTGIDLFSAEIKNWRAVDPSLRLEVQDATRLGFPRRKLRWQRSPAAVTRKSARNTTATWPVCSARRQVERRAAPACACRQRRLRDAQPQRLATPPARRGRTQRGRIEGDLVSGEQTMMMARLVERGGRVVYAPEAAVDHHSPAERLTWRWMWRRAEASGREAGSLNIKLAPLPRRLG